MKRILVAEDDADIRDTVRDLLCGEGYEVETAADGTAALAAWRGAEKPFDLVVLDVMMPGKSGYDVCREIRAEKGRVAVLMLSAKGEEIDKVVGLELGADDYVTKPFGARELLARVAALLRRTGETEAPAAASVDFEFCGAMASASRYALEGSAGSVAVTELEMRLMRALAENRGKVMSRDALLDIVWGTSYYGTTRTLDQHLVNLRRKLERVGGDTSAIRTVHGVGYSYS